MSKSIKFLVLVGIVATVAACNGRKEEYDMVEPISVEPVYTGKYK